MELTDAELDTFKYIVTRLLNKRHRDAAQNARQKASTGGRSRKEAILEDQLPEWGEKDASQTSVPSDADLRRMYNVIQADATLTKRIAGLGFGNSGDAYRRAAIKLHLLAIMNVLRDGKNIRNDIVHKPGYIPSEDVTARALREYAQADSDISNYLQQKTSA